MPKQTGREVKIGRPNLVIGLTGPFGSGCGQMRQVLESVGFRSFKISDDIRGELKGKKLIKKGEPNWRKILQDHGNDMRREHRVYWIERLVKRIDAEGIGESNIVIDGFRNFQEVQEIRKVYPKFFLVAVCAEKNERWQRVKNDYEGRYNEFERDDRRDRSEDFSWGQSVQKCVDDSDYVYYNNDNFFVYPQGKEEPNSDKIRRTLKNQAEDFLSLMQEKDDCRGPHPEEVQMAAAYAQSNSSRCIKRHVGAVVTVNKNGMEFPISMGFNENPPHVPTCSKLQVCCKDEDMAAKLKARGKAIHCPSCGKPHTELSEPWTCCQCGENFKESLYPSRNMELCTAIHAEERAILSLDGRAVDCGRLYATTFPCFQCARLILDAGIKKVLYVEAYPMKETSKFLVKNGVKVVPFTGFTARAFFRVFKKVN